MSKVYDYVIYHGPCPDGVTALWASHEYLSNINYNYEPIQCKAGTDPERNFHGKKILFVDLCPSLKFIVDTCKIAEVVTILDHHKSAIDMYYENEQVLNSINNLHMEIDPDRAGCQIAWDYFNKNPSPHTKTRPWFVDYVADRDLWKWELPFSKEINSALYENNYIDPSNLNKLSELLIDSENKKQKLMEHGELIIQIQNRELGLAVSKSLISEFKHKNHTYKIWLGGNISMNLRSELGNLLVNKKFPDGTSPDFAAIWFYDPKTNEWWISFRGGQQSPDLSVIARELGFGGHASAAGITIRNGKTLLDLFKIVQIN